MEREHESKEAVAQQKRRVTRQWEVLARVKQRHAVLERRAAAENTQLAEEFLGVTRAYAHLQAKCRHFKAADAAKFEQVWHPCRWVVFAVSMVCMASLPCCLRAGASHEGGGA